MNKAVGLSGIVIGLALLLSGCTQNVATNETVATIAAIQGTVDYHPASSEEKIALQPKDSGRNLYHLDKLVVGQDSYLQIQLGDEGELFAEPGTTLLIQRPEVSKPFQVFVNLVEGVLNCFIEKRDSKFAVQTPVTVAGVLGTRFRLDVQGSETSATLIESDKGLALQSLKQDLSAPIVLKTSQSPSGALYGAAITFSKKLDAETLPEISEQVRTVENIHEVTYPVFGNGKVERRSYLDFGVRTTTVER